MNISQAVAQKLEEDKALLHFMRNAAPTDSLPDTIILIAEQPRLPKNFISLPAEEKTAIREKRANAMEEAVKAVSAVAGLTVETNPTMGIDVRGTAQALLQALELPAIEGAVGANSPIFEIER